MFARSPSLKSGGTGRPAWASFQANRQAVTSESSGAVFSSGLQSACQRPFLNMSKRTRKPSGLRNHQRDIDDDFQQDEVDNCRNFPNWPLAALVLDEKIPKPADNPMQCNQADDQQQHTLRQILSIQPQQVLESVVFID
jgi:hypothetical protein